MAEWIVQNLGALGAGIAAVLAILIQHRLMLWRVAVLESSRKEYRDSIEAKLREMQAELNRECDNLIRRMEGGEKDSRRAWVDGLQRLSTVEAKVAGIEHQMDKLHRRWESRGS